MAEQHNPNLGYLLTPDIKLHRMWFNQMVKAIGIQVQYYQPRPDKHYTSYAEIRSTHYDPITVGCIFTEHPDQRTMKKLGWVSELQESASIIQVPYDTPGIQKGALFLVPSGIDGAEGRLFRVSSMMTTIVYPAFISCEIVPEFKNTFEKSLLNYKHTDFNLLNSEEE